MALVLCRAERALRRQASAERAPALLDVVCAFAASRNLAPLLADAPSVRGVPEAFPAARAAEPWAAEQHLGTRCAANHSAPALLHDFLTQTMLVTQVTM